MRPGFRFAAGLAVLAVLVPASVRAQEWHELYANGQQALRNGQFERAADFLKRAIQKRPQPGVAVPTYGTNFEPRYFPYLRLAEAYLRLDALDAASDALATSARFAAEPATERAALETRVKAALEAKRPAQKPVESPPPAPAPNPPAAPPESLTARAPARQVAVPPAETTRASPPPPAPGSRAAEPLRRDPPALDLTSDPPGAQVFVDDELVGRTDPQTGRLRLTSLRPGRHRVRLSADGREDLVREIELSGGAVAFQGVLSIMRGPPPLPEPPDPTIESKPPLSRWTVLGILLLIVLAPTVWFLSYRSRPSRTEATATGGIRSSGGVSGGSVSYEELPMEFGDYLLIRRIGKGGMATVYEAERRGEKFAVKRPLAGYLDDPRFLERFVREADLGRALHHPNVIRIYDRGQVGGIPYFAMELIDGETLRERLDRDGRLDPTFATGVVSQVAEALDYAHHKGVIHRDLKPSNIMLQRSGGVKVMDYGIARAQHLAGVTTTGGFLGTPHYAAPEALDGVTGPRSDLYSLGIVFFEMLTGSVPFRGESPLAVLHHHGATPPPAPSSLNYAVPAQLDRIVLGLLSKEPSDRPTAEALLNQLADYLEEAR